MALVTAGGWTSTAELDVLLDAVELPPRVTVHVGAAAVPARMRRLGGKAARLRLGQPLPLHLGDRLVVRDPGSRRLTGADVADLRPSPLRRRGDAARLGLDLRVPARGDDELARRGLCRADEIRAAGLPSASSRALRVGEWLVDPVRWGQLREGVRARAASMDELSGGASLQDLARQLDLPDLRLVTAIVDDLPDVVCTDGRVRLVPGEGEPSAQVPPAVGALLARLARDPLDAPDAAELADLGAGRAELAAAVRAGLLLRLTDTVYVAPTAAQHAVSVLAGLDGPFTVSAARAALGSNRRVVVPLLEHLDAARATRRLPDGTRLLVPRPA
jgi:selenocysteine-specific elongation factor